MRDRSPVTRSPLAAAKVRLSGKSVWLPAQADWRWEAPGSRRKPGLGARLLPADALSLDKTGFSPSLDDCP
jgi:hypothetical protein